jgi:hypothetical protein
MEDAFSGQELLGGPSSEFASRSAEITVQELSPRLHYFRNEVSFSTLLFILDQGFENKRAIAHGPNGVQLLDDYPEFHEGDFLVRIVIEGVEIRWTPHSENYGTVVLVSESSELLRGLLPQSEDGLRWTNWEISDVAAVAEVQHDGWHSREYLSKTVDGNLLLVDEIVLSTPDR